MLHTQPPPPRPTAWLCVPHGSFKSGREALLGAPVPSQKPEAESLLNQMVFVTWMSQVQKTLVELIQVKGQEWATPRRLFLRLGEEPACARGWGAGLDPALEHNQREVPGCCRWRHEVYHRAAEGDSRPGVPLLSEGEQSQESQG